MNLEQKKQYVLYKINKNSSYKKKSIDNSYTIETYLESIGLLFSLDLISKINFLKNKNYVCLTPGFYEEDVLRLEEYVDFLLEMYNYVILNDIKNSSELPLLHQSRFDLWVVNNMYL